ncbi:MAG: 50S ribosomal protein L6 [Clostridia bacterium]|nr:50S ribosomal protein L6 [Clostridia bacterium]
MSRIGRAPIAVPAGVTITRENNTLTVKGPKGSLTSTFHQDIEIHVEPTEIRVTRPDDKKEHRALHGLTRALIANMVLGVTEGFKKTLEISDGYRAAKQGTKLVLNIGYSHEVYFEDGDGITFDVPAPNQIIVNGIDKQRVGQVASEIRGKRPPEPYLGKGIRYAGEHIRRKAGKSGK